MSPPASRSNLEAEGFAPVVKRKASNKDGAAKALREAGEVATTAGYQLLSIDELFASPKNPRRRFDETKLQELAASIASRGVIEPLIVRKHGAGYEIVAGERRWRASQIAKLDVVPCIVREYSDEDLAYIRLEENLHREDLDPLEEADAVAELHKRYSAVELAARLSRSESWVHRRLRLAAVRPEVRELVAAGRIGVAGALLIAQCDEDLQASLVTDINAPNRADRGTLSATAVEHLVRESARSLDRAPWDLADRSLVPDAPACVACPQRSTAQSELFAATRIEGDRCMAPACWAKKEAAHWAERKVAVQAAGGQVLKGEEAKAILPHGGHYVSGGCINIQDRAYIQHEERGTEEAVTESWAELLPRLGVEVPRTIASWGKVTVEVVREEDLGRALEPVLPKTALRYLPTLASKRMAECTPEEQAAKRAEREKVKKQREDEQRQVDELFEAVAEHSDLDVATVICRLVALRAGRYDTRFRDAAKRREVTVEDLERKVRGNLLTNADLRVLAIELLTIETWNMHHSGSAFQWARHMYGLPAKGVSVDDDPEPEYDEPEDADSCRGCGCTENSPCEGGCHWVPEEEDPDPEALMEDGPICSQCFEGKP